ncbi:MAG: C40 family peptidase [Emticicia sp.]|nr:C40 family peptidase [Emticicia sp.]
MVKNCLAGLLFVIFSLSSFASKANFSGDSPARKPSISTTEEPTEDSYLKLANDIQRYAKKFIGTRYKSGGKATKGFDCSGFVGYVFKKFDMKLGACSTEMFRLGYDVETNEALAGDLIFFKRSKNSKSGISHVGIVVESTAKGLKFIHSASSKGVTISYLKDPYYSAHFVGVKRVIDSFK